MSAHGPLVAGLPFGWGAVLNVITLLLGGGAFAAWLKTRPKMRELSKTAEEKLRDDLIARVEKLEQGRETERAEHDASMAIMRHRLNNVTQCLDALLMLIEQDPARAQEAAGRVREMRARQEAAEATEKGAVQAAKIARVPVNAGDPS